MWAHGIIIHSQSIAISLSLTSLLSYSIKVTINWTHYRQLSCGGIQVMEEYYSYQLRNTISFMRTVSSVSLNAGVCSQLYLSTEQALTTGKVFQLHKEEQSRNKMSHNSIVFDVCLEIHLHDTSLYCHFTAISFKQLSF